MVRVVGRVRLTHNKHGSDHGLTIFASGSKKSGFGSSQNFLTQSGKYPTQTLFFLPEVKTD